MEQVFQRVANWNSVRYDRQYNQALTLKLLREEYREWLEADTIVDQVQELCDIIFVAYGAIWKLNEEMAGETANVCFANVDAIADRFRIPGVCISSCIDSLELMPLATAQEKMMCLFSAALYAQAQLFTFGLNFEQVIDCLLVLCDSNDSKTVKKTASDVKANDNDKGAYYKSPIPGLTAILERVQNAKH